MTTASVFRDLYLDSHGSPEPPPELNGIEEHSVRAELDQCIIAPVNAGCFLAARLTPGLVDRIWSHGWF